MSVALAALLVSTPTDGVAQRDGAPPTDGAARTDGAAQTGLAGYWDFVIMSESGEPQVRLRVKLDITQDGQLRGATGPAGPSEMTGSLKGSTVELFWDTDFEGTPVAFRFTGTATGDTMSGSVEIDFGELGGVSQSNWTATRAGPLA